ncbi:alpha/beta hydrolase [Sporichthya brevicatena]|uniref:Alpha/beta hydrolase n=1 Tax=Sporichthya brevicatena TaxID=171442 RepID=A0ABN1G367_9ACTN
MRSDGSSPADVAWALEGPWTHRQIAANGARFHVAEVGEGPLVLLLHGFPTFWWTWRHQLVALADAGYRAVAMDLRGYGGSDKTPRGYDPMTLTGDVAGVVQSLGEAEATIVGHGWGGLLAWTSAVFEPKVVRRLAAVSAPHPRRMRAAALDRRQVAASSYLLGYQRPWIPERKLVADDGAAVGELLHAWGAAPAWPDAETERIYRRAIQVQPVAHCALEYHRWAFRSLARPDGLRYARRMRTPIPCPVLHLHGARDPVVRPGTAAGSGRYVAGPYSWSVVPEVGHFPHEEAPEAVTRLLLRWMQET